MNTNWTQKKNKFGFVFEFLQSEARHEEAY